MNDFLKATNVLDSSYMCPNRCKAGNYVLQSISNIESTIGKTFYMDIFKVKFPESINLRGNPARRIALSAAVGKISTAFYKSSTSESDAREEHMSGSDIKM